MKRIDARTVELTARETELRARFDDLLDEGHSVTHAALVTIRETATDGPGTIPISVDPAFVEYLSEGTVTLTTRRTLTVRPTA